MICIRLGEHVFQWRAVVADEGDRAQGRRELEQRDPALYGEQ